MPSQRMSWLAAALALVCAAAAGDAAAQQREASRPRPDLVGKQFDARVTRVADGDTLDAIPAGESAPIRIRLQGVDAPELGEVFSREAQRFLRTLVFDRRVRVEARDIDRYGRLVARVWAGEDASVALVRAGLACHAYARDAALAREEAEARRTGRGFWAAGAATPACVTATAFSGRPDAPEPRSPATAAPRSSTRAPSTRPRVPAGYRGNTRSGLYHASTCPNADCRNCTRLFTTEAEAQAAGFKPAGDCLKR